MISLRGTLLRKDCFLSNRRTTTTCTPICQGCKRPGHREEVRTEMSGDVWKLKCPRKVHHFLWRFGHNSHPLNMNIGRRGVELDTRCEDGGHFFLRCLEGERDQLLQITTPLQVLEIIFGWVEDRKMRTVCVLWRWWSERNKKRHGERRLSPPEFASQVTKLTKGVIGVLCQTTD